jgi:acyl-CoA dehydrogenase
MGEWIPQCFGTPEDPKVGAFCVSEPDAGSDVSSLRTRAVYDEAKDEWVLNGQKAWATNGGIANVHVVVASVDRELGSRGQAAFVVPPGTKGLEMGTKVKKHGLRASHTADIFLDDCRIPARACSAARRSSTSAWRAPRGHARSGRRRCRRSRRRARRSARRRSASPARLRVRARVRQERSQFGSPIIENQAIAFALADMKLEIDAARLLVWRASWMGRTASRSTTPRAR